jgi:hypothetical protein
MIGVLAVVELDHSLRQWGICPASGYHFVNFLRCLQTDFGEVMMDGGRGAFSRTLFKKVSLMYLSSSTFKSYSGDVT